MTEKTVKKLIANISQNQLNVRKSKSKRKSSRNKKSQPESNMKSPVIDMIASSERVREKQRQKEAKQNEPKLVCDAVFTKVTSKSQKMVIKNVNHAPSVRPRTIKSKSAVCKKRSVSTARKRNTIWTKFPPDEVVAPKDQRPKPTSVYQPGVSYSDVVFSAGPCCTVKIKTLATDTITPPLVLNDTFPSPDQKVHETSIAKSKKVKKFSHSIKTKVRNLNEVKLKSLSNKFNADVRKVQTNLETGRLKIKNEPSPKDIETDTIPVKNEFLAENVKTVLLPKVKNETDVITLKNDLVPENIGTDRITLQNKSSPVNVETECLPKVKNINNLNFETYLLPKNKNLYTFNLPYLKDTPSSSDENANFSEPSENDSESNIGRLPDLIPPKDTLNQFPSTSGRRTPTTFCDIKPDTPWFWHRIPREKESPGNTFFGIQFWNFSQPYKGPEIYPRHSRHFTDESYLYAEDLANIAFKLALGK